MNTSTDTFSAFDRDMMTRALQAAEDAASLGEVPIAAVIARQNQFLLCAANATEHLQNAVAHAEIRAISEACRLLKTRYLDDCTLYVTLEPCPMCAGAIIQARIPRLVYAAPDPKAGAIDSKIRLFEYQFPHHPTLECGLCANESAALLKDFFRHKRRQNKLLGNKRCRRNLAIQALEARRQSEEI